MQNELKFLQLEKISETYGPAGYKVLSLPKNPVKRRLANLLWSWLFKLGALEQYLEHEVEFRYGKEEKGAISELVNEQVISVINRGYRIEDYCLIVGGKEFSEILKNPSLFWAVCNCPYWAISWLSTLKRVSFSLSRDTG